MNTHEKIKVIRPAGALAVATTEYSLPDTAKVTSAATGTTTNKLVDTAGAFVVNLIAVGDVVYNSTTGKYALVTAIDSATQLSLGADIMLSGNAYAIYSGLGWGFNGRNYKELIAVLNLTAAATAAADTLDVYVDGSYDGGITWVNLIHFAQILGNGSVKKFMATIGNGNSAASAVDASSDAAAGAVRQCPVPSRIRHRAVAVDGGAAGDVSFNYTLTITAKTI